MLWNPDLGARSKKKVRRIATRHIDVKPETREEIAKSLGITDPAEKAKLKSGTIHIVHEVDD